MRDESEWRWLSNASPACLSRSVSAHARPPRVSKDEEHCSRRALVMLRATLVDALLLPQLPLLFQLN